MAFSFNKTNPAASNLQLGFNYPLVEQKVGAPPAQFEIFKLEIAFRAVRTYGSSELTYRLGLEATFLTFGKLALTFYDSDGGNGTIQ